MRARRHKPTIMCDDGTMRLVFKSARFLLRLLIEQLVVLWPHRDVVECWRRRISENPTTQLSWKLWEGEGKGKDEIVECIYVNCAINIILFLSGERRQNSNNVYSLILVFSAVQLNKHTHGRRKGECNSTTSTSVKWGKRADRVMWKNQNKNIS